MKSKRWINRLFSIVLAIAMLFTIVQNNHIDAQAEETIIALVKASNAQWKDGSTATAVWDKVDGADYYIVNLYVNYNGEELGVKETGTAGTEIDLQHEINDIIGSIKYDQVQISFDVCARYTDDENDTTVLGDVSDKSAEINYIVSREKQKLLPPTNINLADNMIVNWDRVEGARHYRLVIKYEYNEEEYIYDYLLSFISQKSTDIISDDISSYVRRGYESKGFTYEQVNVSYKVISIAGISDDYYIDSDFSEWSNAVSYSAVTRTVCDVPSNVNFDEDTTVASWNRVDEADYYNILIKYEYDGEVIVCNYPFFTVPQSKNEIVSRNITDYIQKGLDYCGINSDQVKVSFKVKSVCNQDNMTYENSDYSDWSDEIMYTRIIEKECAIPTDIHLDENNLIASWKRVEGADYYHIMLRYNDGDKVAEFDDVSANISNKISEIIECNIANSIKLGYEMKNYEPAPIKVAIKVVALCDSENIYYNNGEYSDWSNEILFNPYDLAVVEGLTLVPNKPVVTVGKSIYLGKTIYPENGYYKTIKWSSKDTSIATVDANGKVTGVKVGTTEVTAKIGAVTATVVVTVNSATSSNDSQAGGNQKPQPAPQVKPGAEQSSVTADKATTKYKKGDIVTDTKTGSKVKITNTDKKEVTYVSPTKKKSVVSVPSKVTINGVTYKVTKIADGAFKGNNKLTKVTIPASVKSIGKSAFYGCKNLKTVTIKTTKLTSKSVGKNAFAKINAKAKVKVPKSKLKAYKKILKAKGIKGKKQKITK